MKKSLIVSAVMVALCTPAGAADDPMTQYVDSLQCGETTIEIASEYGNGNCGTLRAQKITLKTGTDRMVLDSVGTQVRVPAGLTFPAKDGSLTNYQCVADVYNPKIILNFSNGGSCETCLWSAIYSVNNRLLSGGRSEPEREDFRKAYATLSFSNSRAEQGFIGVSRPACK